MTEDVRTDNDDLLNRATAALRDCEVPAGPSAALVGRTLGAMRAGGASASSSPNMRIGPMRHWRAAAAILLATGLVAAVIYFSTKPRGQIVSVPERNPGTPRVTPGNPSTGPVFVKNDPENPKKPSNVIPKLPDRTPKTPEQFASAVSPGIRGTVFFDGPAPEPQRIDMSMVKECAIRHPQGGVDQRLLVHNGRLANAVVSILVPDNVSFDFKLPDGPVFLDQINCQYEPHMLAAMVGQELIVKNSDPFLHNVHALPADNPTFNFGQPTIDFGRKVLALTHPERFQVRCDIHPWMSAWVYVFEHPFFAVTRPDGTFEIPPGLPDGTYQVTAWHETLGMQQGQVTIDNGSGTTAFTFLALQAQGKNAAVQLAAAKGSSRVITPCEKCVDPKRQ